MSTCKVPHITPKREVSPEEINRALKQAEVRHKEQIEKIVDKAHTHLQHVNDVVSKESQNEWVKSHEKMAYIEIAHNIAKLNRDRLLHERQDKAAADVERAKMLAARAKQAESEPLLEKKAYIELAHRVAESNRNKIIKEKKNRAAADVLHAKMAVKRMRDHPEYHGVPVDERKGYIELAHDIAESNRERFLEQRQEKAGADVDHAKMVAEKLKEERKHIEERVWK